MPNWCTNTLCLSGPRREMENLIATLEHKEENGLTAVLDFNQIIPMPAELETTPKGSDQAIGLALLGHKVQLTSYRSALNRVMDYDPTLREQVPALASLPREQVLPILERSSASGVQSALAQGKLSLAMLQKYGALDWYDWSIKHWGTKWNACEPQREDPVEDGETLRVTYTFDTAWNFPEPILHALAARFPAVTFTVRGDEESGAFYVDGVGRGGALELVYVTDGVRPGGPYDHGDYSDNDNTSALPAEPPAESTAS